MGERGRGRAGAGVALGRLDQFGRARRLDDASGRYVEFCKSTYSNELSLRGLSVVVDGAHGAAYHVAPDVFHEPAPR